MKGEKESLLDTNSIAGARFEKAVQARLATALLKSSCRAQRLNEKDPGRSRLMTPQFEEQGSGET